MSAGFRYQATLDSCKGLYDFSVLRFEFYFTQIFCTFSMLPLLCFKPGGHQGSHKNLAENGVQASSDIPEGGFSACLKHNTQLATRAKHNTVSHICWYRQQTAPATKPFQDGEPFQDFLHYCAVILGYVCCQEG